MRLACRESWTGRESVGVKKRVARGLDSYCAMVVVFTLRTGKDMVLAYYLGSKLFLPKL